MKQNIQPTSIAAYHSVTENGTISQQKALILAALEIMGEGNAYQISQRISLDKHMIGRRLGELAKDGKIQDTGRKAPTDSGRASIVYSLVKAAQ